MLLMSRRQDEDILFPALGITLTLLSVHGNAVRLGGDAPRDITVLREDVVDTTQSPNSAADPHSVRNVLNSVNLYVMLYQQQVENGMVEAAADTFMKMLEFLEEQTQQGTIEFKLSTDEDVAIDGRIMIVAEETDQRDLLASLLAMQGLDVTTHSDDQAALKALQQQGSAPEVILLDWAMPNFGGQWLVQRIRREFGDDGPKLFVVTEARADKTPERSSVDAWMAKPLHHEALLARIRAVCQSVYQNS